MLDDRMVMTENSVVKQGVSGIPTLLAHDSFYGFDSDLGRTGQRKTYRPLSFVMFALEWQFFPNVPVAGHIVHVILYAGLGVLLLFLLRRLFRASSKEKNGSFLTEWLPFWVALLFVAHPIHTEVVSNIKSRDEILALLCALGSLLLLIKSVDTNSPVRQGVSALLFGLALLSKESAVAFVPVFPLALYFFRPALRLKNIAIVSAPILAVTLIYLALWFGVMGRVDEASYSVPLTNPFVYAGFGERTATVLWILMLYIEKALYPITLSHSYTFNVIPIMDWLHWKPLLALVVCASFLGFAVSRTGRRDPLAFCIWYFFCTIAIASNLFVYTGGLLGERFLFTPSIAAVLGVLLLAIRFLRREWVFVAVGIIIVAFSTRTISRNDDWASEEALFKADATNTQQSYQAQTEYAKALFNKSLVTNDGLVKGQLLNEALEHLEAARAIDSTDDPQLYSIFGLCYAEIGDIASALRFGKMGFERVQTATLYRTMPGYMCYAAKCYGQTILNAAQQGRFSDSTQMNVLLRDGANVLRTALQKDTPLVDADVPMTLANCYDALSQYDSAMTFSEVALAVKTSRQHHKDNYVIIAGNYGGSLMQQGRFDEAASVFARSVKMYDGSARLHWGLGMANVAAGRYEAAVPSLRRAVELDPTTVRLKDDLARAEALAKK
jgi:tetratricopeptide (TPR) repeat protein